MFDFNFKFNRGGFGIATLSSSFDLQLQSYILGSHNSLIRNWNWDRQVFSTGSKLIFFNRMVECTLALKIQEFVFGILLMMSTILILIIMKWV